MNRRMLSRLLVLVMAAALLVCFTGCGNDEELAALQEENAALKAQVESMASQLSELGQYAGLKDFTSTAVAWADNDGATVSITATPLLYTEGQSASISVLLEGQEAKNVPCNWNGTAYTASVELTAADGYTFLCALTSANGNVSEFVLDSAEMDAVVYLATNLSSYANMVVDGWEEKDGQLVLTSGYIQVQTPRLSGNGGAVTVTGSSLVLQLDGKEFRRMELTIPQGENENSYELMLTDLVLDMPETEGDYQLDLILEVTTSGGQTLTAAGGSWYYTDGDLLLVVG